MKLCYSSHYRPKMPIFPWEPGFIARQEAIDPSSLLLLGPSATAVSTMVVGLDTIKNEFVLEESSVTERTQDVKAGFVQRVMVAEPLLAKEASQ